MPDLEFYLGTYTSSLGGGIHHVRVPGGLPGRAEVRLVAEARNPSWIAVLPGCKTLLASQEVGAPEQPQLLTFRIGEAQLTPTGATALPGSYPCHIGVHPELPLAATAHYGDGSAALWHIAPGTGTASLLQRLQLSGHGPNSRRQEGSHAHFAAFIEDGNCLVVTDLGSDAVHFFQLNADDSPNLIARQRLDLPPGSGPRHLVAGSDKLYLVCELDRKSMSLSSGKAFIVSVERSLHSARPKFAMARSLPSSSHLTGASSTLLAGTSRQWHGWRLLRTETLIFAARSIAAAANHATSPSTPPDNGWSWRTRAPTVSVCSSWIGATALRNGLAAQLASLAQHAYCTRREQVLQNSFSL